MIRALSRPYKIDIFAAPYVTVTSKVTITFAPIPHCQNPYHPLKCIQVITFGRRNMADPLTIGIASALGVGLGQVSKILLQKGLVEPALKPAINKIAKKVTGGYKQAKEEQVLLEAVHYALDQVGAPQDPDKLTEYLLNRGFDLLRAEGNTALRQEIAQAALLQTAPDVALVPEHLARILKMPANSRVILGQILFHLRQKLVEDNKWGDLVTQSQKGEANIYLRQLAHNFQLVTSVAQRFDYNLALLLQHFGLPDKPDGQTLEEYLTYLVKEYEHISFVLTKARRRNRIASEAELDAVFVPLHVQNTLDRRQKKRRTQLWRQSDSVEDIERQPNLLTINEVLAKHATFILIGEPGAGKTTILRHLTMSFARGDARLRLDWHGESLLPILVPLRNFGRFLTQNEARYTNPAPQALREFITNYFAEHELELSAGFFQERLKQGRCLVLLDGLDEVADRNLRAQVAQFVNGFIKKYGKDKEGKGNYFGLASRPRGYEQVADYLPRLAVCEVQPLIPEDRDKLVTNLLIELVSNARVRRKKTQDLIADIRRKEKVDLLSRNPLFCTTLVLVYEYQGTALPERRVDVYQELVNLMLGFWETHKVDREGVADAHELVLLDGTGRRFLEEREAVEAKERVLKYLASWMQAEGWTEVPKEAATTELANYFAEMEGANETQKVTWAKRFLDVAHQRSGLFVEFDTGSYAFSHKNFLEYLAAESFRKQLDGQIVQQLQEHGANPWWEEIFRLAFAHKEFSDPHRGLVVDTLLAADNPLLAGRCVVDAGARVRPPLLKKVQDALYKRMMDGNLTPKERYAAGELLDESGWLPDDLHKWVRCPATSEERRDMWAAKYPVTNEQYALFIEAGGYSEPAYWGGKKSKAWQWRQGNKRPFYDEATTSEPVFWQDMRFGKERRGYPVVGVSWYEAMAYASWLTVLLRQVRAGADGVTAKQRDLVADLVEADVQEVRLPMDVEWVRLAGGGANERYPWDKPGRDVANEQEAAKLYANVYESEIGQTSPVVMYPQGESEPFGLAEMAGNVWEWMGIMDDDDSGGRVVRGGSWLNDCGDARVSVRYDFNPGLAHHDIGFRVVAPVSGS